MTRGRSNLRAIVLQRFCIQLIIECPGLGLELGQTAKVWLDAESAR